MNTLQNKEKQKSFDFMQINLDKVNHIDTIGA